MKSPQKSPLDAYRRQSPQKGAVDAYKRHSGLSRQSSVHSYALGGSTWSSMRRASGLDGPLAVYERCAGLPCDAAALRGDPNCPVYDKEVVYVADSAW